MNNRVNVPLYASLLSVALLTASCSSGETFTGGTEQTSQGQGTGQGKTANGGNTGASGNESGAQGETVIPYQASVLVEGLNAPWEIVSVPDGRMFVTERPGAIRVIEDGKLASEPLIEFSGSV